MQHRIYVPGVPLEGEITIGGEEFHHAVRVVRIREGESVELFDGKGSAVSAVVETLGRDSATVRVTTAIESRETKAAIHLAMAVIQLEKFELVLQKATELGVRSITPLVTDRVELRPERYRGKHERWEKIVFEAVKQSGRAVIPAVGQPATFDEAIDREGLRILFDADTEPSQIDLLREPSVILYIGPEGGWSERELGIAKAKSCAFSRLGPRRLRAETAAIVAAATIAARSGELN